MRSNLLVGISSAVAAVAVAGSASAALVVDPFTTVATFGNASAAWQTSSSSPAFTGLFAQRQAQRFNGGTGTVGSGSWNFVVTRNTSQPATSQLNYRQDSVYTPINLSSIASMSFSVSSVSGTLDLSWYLEDENSNALSLNTSMSANTTVTLNFGSAVKDPGFDLTKVTGMTVKFSGPSSGNTVTGATVSNFTYTLVPAPGAAALVGAAGLIAARRRKA